jgi:hypothetical protein
MDSFRNSEKARFFQPGFSSCIMVTVLLREEARREKSGYLAREC